MTGYHSLHGNQFHLAYFMQAGNYQQCFKVSFNSQIDVVKQPSTVSSLLLTFPVSYTLVVFCLNYIYIFKFFIVFSKNSLNVVRCCRSLL